MSVKLGRYKYIATQGPCPEGFHVPTKSEWELLIGTIVNALGLPNNGNTMKTYLKIPLAGRRIFTTSNADSKESVGFYWHSTRSTNDKAYNLYFYSSNIATGDHNMTSNAYSIRPFYNEGISPNGGWQVLYQGTGSAGIYWHKDLGLITVSSNGTDWITIADKNLGATTVYNSGDTLSEDNCGGYYQWGNNYMFPRDGTLTPSSTRVNASDNGPGNYYQSSVFINSNSGWDITNNYNLWGGVDGNVWKDVESIGGLPSEYQEVEYIESSGTQRIDTGVIAKQTTINQIKVRPLGITGSLIYGYDNNNDNTDYRLFNYNSQIYWDISNQRVYGSSFSSGTDYEFEFGNNYVKNVGASSNILTGTTVGSYTSEGTIKLNYNEAGAISSNRWYYVKIRDGQTQVRDFIPCYRKSDGVIGMYDTVNEAFYTNAGTGTFTKGNDVSSDMDSGEHQLDEHSMFPQGPCPDGYHVPLNSEWNKIKTFFSSCGILTGGNVCTYLKLAPDGYLSNTGTSKSEYNQYANSWSNYKGSGGTCARLSVGGPNYSPNYNSRPSPGGGLWSTVAMHIRPFKNLIVKPDSSWTTLYDGSSVATGAGIFWNSGLGLITIYDGGDYITIADKNLGATTVWDGGTTYNEANCGKFYQWGNNYAFPFSGQSPGSTAQVDASDYGPNNLYSSSTWINTGTTDWDSSHNGDLWGGVSKSELKQYYSFNLLNEYIGEYHECEVNTMGPCPSGFHIPTRQEWHDLYDIGYALGLWDATNYGRQLQLQFNIPVCGKLNNDGTYTSSPTDAVYWCADKQSSSYGRDVWLRTTTDVATIDDDTTMIRGGSIRPFRNMPLIPTTSDSNWSIPSGSNPANGGIYDNETEGVISISADGAHWMTLADKNCGATTKWYLNNTMSEANCGKFYQWGNNHGFPFTGATKTSSTAVDASDYGPFSEYYDDDTFITTSPWDTSDNRNLWGGVSGPTRNCDISGGGSLGPSTVVCDFRSGASGEATPYSVLVANNNFVAQRSGYNSIGQGNNGTLRLTIPRTDYAGAIRLGGGEAWGNWISNAGYNTGNTSSWNTSLKQNLIKKAYLTVSAISSTSYPNFGKAGVYIDFCKKVESSNVSNGSASVAGFVFPRSNYSSYSGYQLYPSDVDVKYLVLPSTPNIAWNGTTCSDYINQGVTSIGSKVIIETRGSSPSDLHYWLTIEVTGNEYDLGLCSDLGACSINVECGDWWQVGSYKEISEAYLEMYDSWYIDYDGNITDTKPW